MGAGVSGTGWKASSSDKNSIVGNLNFFVLGDGLFDNNLFCDTPFFFEAAFLRFRKVLPIAKTSSDAKVFLDAKAVDFSLRLGAKTSVEVFTTLPFFFF